MKTTTPILGLSALAITTVLLLSVSLLIDKQSSLLVPIIVLGVGLQSMAVFGALFWALPRSNRAFFSIFVGDALLRLVGLGWASFWLWSGHLPYTGPLLSLAAAYLLMSFVQIPFFYKAR